MGCSTATRAGVALAILLVAARAHADAPSREAAAQTLFEEATSLFARGEYDRACEKFKASDELDAKGGTELNLALCREKQGRVASAWTAFTSARNRSLKEGRNERVTFADKKIAELRPLLPKLRVVVTAEAPSLEVKVDGEVLQRAAWDTSLPIDPGEHTVDATAPERKPVHLTVSTKKGEEATVTVPALAEAEKITSTPSPRSASPPEKPSRWLGWTLAGTGVVAIGVGSVFGVEAFGKRSDAEDLCAANRCAEGRSANDDGTRAAWISNIAIGVGVVALGVGIWMLVRDPAPRATAHLARARSAP